MIDVATNKVAGHIRAKGQVLFAAGKTHVVLILPDVGVMETWSLDTLTRTASKPIPCRDSSSRSPWAALRRRLALLRHGQREHPGSRGELLPPEHRHAHC